MMEQTGCYAMYTFMMEQIGFNAFLIITMEQTGQKEVLVMADVTILTRNSFQEGDILKASEMNDILTLIKQNIRDIEGCVKKSQGANNANKTLGIDDSGNVTVQAVGYPLFSIDNNNQLCVEVIRDE